MSWPAPIGCLLGGLCSSSRPTQWQSRCRRCAPVAARENAELAAERCPMGVRRGRPCRTTGSGTELPSSRHAVRSADKRACPSLAPAPPSVLGWGSESGRRAHPDPQPGPRSSGRLRGEDVGRVAGRVRSTGDARNWSRSAPLLRHVMNQCTAALEDEPQVVVVARQQGVVPAGISSSCRQRWARRLGRRRDRR
jgi:hypothetical protein